MLPRRLCLVPLLLALGVGSSGGSGDGGDSRRRRLLAAKGGCWGSFFLTRKKPGKAGWRVQTADLGVQYHPFLWQLRFLRARSPKSAPLAVDPRGFPVHSLGGVLAPRRRRGLWSAENFGALCAGLGVSRAWFRDAWSRAGYGRSRRQGGRGGGQVSVYSCPGGKNQGRLQRSELSWTGTPGWGWRGNL